MQVKKRLFIKPFLSYDKVAMERYLEKQAQKGWMLERADNGLVFRKATPIALHFSVVYFPDSRDLFPLLTIRQKEFLQLCAHTGWELVTNTPWMLILCNREQDPIPIETDPVLEVEAIGKIILGRWNPCGIPLVGFLLLTVYWLYLIIRWPYADVLADFVRADMSFPLWLFLCFWQLRSAGFLLWRKKARKIAETEGRLHPVRFGWDLYPLLMTVVLVGGAFLCLSYTQESARFWEGILWWAVVFFLPRIDVAMHRRQMTAKKQRVVWAAGIFLLFLVTSLIGLGQWQVESRVSGTDAGPFLCEHPDWDTPYSHQVYREKIPLRIEDLTGDPYADDQYDARWQAETSPLLVQFEAHHAVCGLGHYITYEITETRTPDTYEKCLTEQLQQDSYALLGNGLYGTKMLYQVYSGDRPMKAWLFCFEDRIATLIADWSLTEEQLQKAAEILGSCPLPNT